MREGAKTCEACGAVYRSKNRRFCSMRCRSDSAHGICDFEGCEKPVRSRNLCTGHSEQRRLGKPLTPLIGATAPQPCVEPGCESLAVLLGRCPKHYRAERGRRLGPCTFDGCDRNAITASTLLCSSHAQQRHRGQELRPIQQQGNRGDGSVDRKGYRRVYRPTDPMAGVNGMVLEHRLVMAQHVGRPLHADESVHHINGDRLDNRIENLELWASPGHHVGQRVEDLVADAIAILERYAPDRLGPGSSS